MECSGYWPAMLDGIESSAGSVAGVGGAVGTAVVSLKMSLKELARPAAISAVKVLCMKCFQDDELWGFAGRAGRSLQLKLQLEMSR